MDRQKGVLDRETEGLLQQKKMNDKNFYADFTFFDESFTLNEIEELEKTFLPIAALKEDTNMFSAEFREGFNLWSLIMAIQ